MPKKPASKGKKGSANVIIAPTGDVYLLREGDEPRKILKGSELEKTLRQYSTNTALRNSLPKDIVLLLEDLFSALGIWHILNRR